MTSDLGRTSSRRGLLADDLADDEASDGAAEPGGAGAAGTGTASPSAETGVVMH
jgi:hypothetical protein